MKAWQAIDLLTGLCVLGVGIWGLISKHQFAPHDFFLMTVFFFLRTLRLIYRKA